MYVVILLQSLQNTEKAEVIGDASTVIAFKARLDKFWSTKQLNMILQLTWPEPETDQKKL